MKRKRAPGLPFSLFSFQDIITSVTGVILLVTLLLALELTLRPTVSPAAETRQIAVELTGAIADAEADIGRLKAVMKSGREEIDNEAGYTLFSATEELKAVKGQIAALETKRNKLQRQRNRAEEQLRQLEGQQKARAPDFQRLERVQRQVLSLNDELKDVTNSNQVFYNVADVGEKTIYLVELFPGDILVALKGERAAPLRFSGRSTVAEFQSWASTKSTTRVHFMILVHPGTTDQFSRIRDYMQDMHFSFGYDLLPNDKQAIDPDQGAE